MNTQYKSGDRIRIQKDIALRFINLCWNDYLEAEIIDVDYDEEDDFNDSFTVSIKIPKLDLYLNEYKDFIKSAKR